MDNGQDGGVHAFPVYPILMRRWPDRTAELLGRLRRALVSDQEGEVREQSAASMHASTRRSYRPNRPMLNLTILSVKLGSALRRAGLCFCVLDSILRDGYFATGRNVCASLSSEIAITVLPPY